MIVGKLWSVAWDGCHKEDREPTWELVAAETAKEALGEITTRYPNASLHEPRVRAVDRSGLRMSQAVPAEDLRDDTVFIFPE